MMMNQRLYQVCVEDRKGKLLSVFPRVPKETADLFVMAIQGQIAQGKEKAWSNPHAVACL